MMMNNVGIRVISTEITNEDYDKATVYGIRVFSLDDDSVLMMFDDISPDNSVVTDLVQKLEYNDVALCHVPDLVEDSIS